MKVVTREVRAEPRRPVERSARRWRALQRSCWLSLALSAIALGAAADGAVRIGSAELFWVPTLDQALAMASATGRPVLLMGYSMVGEDYPTYARYDEALAPTVY